MRDLCKRPCERPALSICVSAVETYRS